MYLGIDIGGTNIKFGVVREDYSIIKKYMISSERTKDVEHIISNIINKCIEIYSEYPYKKIGDRGIFPDPTVLSCSTSCAVLRVAF